MVEFVKLFHHYLYGRIFLVRTDHAALIWLLKNRFPVGQAARWIEILQRYQMKVEHRPGAKHGNADALSRRPCSEECQKTDYLVIEPGDLKSLLELEKVAQEDHIWRVFTRSRSRRQADNGNDGNSTLESSDSESDTSEFPRGRG